MKSARINSLWDLAANNAGRPNRKTFTGNFFNRHPPDGFRVESHWIGKYIFPKMPPEQTTRADIYMTDSDTALLKNFLHKRHQTLGDLLTINTMDGSSTISSLDKLVSFGLVARDWEKESEMHVDAVYSLTTEGNYIVNQKLPEKIV